MPVDNEIDTIEGLVSGYDDDDNRWSGVDTTSCILYVPFGSKTLYQKAKQWKDFTHIEEKLPSGINDLYDFIQVSQVLNLPFLTGKI